jgi:Na+-driven multidrug efflux pump
MGNLLAPCTTLTRRGLLNFGLKHLIITSLGLGAACTEVVIDAIGAKERAMIETVVNSSLIFIVL